MTCSKTPKPPPTKVWFAVTRGLDGREIPCVFRDYLPHDLLRRHDTRLVYSIRLDKLPGRLDLWPLAKLWAAYLKLKSAGTLPPQER